MQVSRIQNLASDRLPSTEQPTRSKEDHQAGHSARDEHRLPTYANAQFFSQRPRTSKHHRRIPANGRVGTGQLSLGRRDNDHDRICPPFPSRHTRSRNQHDCLSLIRRCELCRRRTVRILHCGRDEARGDGRLRRCEPSDRERCRTVGALRRYRKGRDKCTCSAGAAAPPTARGRRERECEEILACLLQRHRSAG